MEEMVLEYLQGIQNPFLDSFFYACTCLADKWMFLFLFFVVYWCVDKKLGFGIGVTMLFTSALNTGIKGFFEAPRPFEVLELRSFGLETAGGSSFPSGHSQSVSTFFTFLSLTVSKKWIAPGVLVTVLVAFSRLYMGVHWPKDVIYGIAVGMIAAGMMYTAYRYTGEILMAVIAIAMMSTVFFLPVEISKDLLAVFASLCGVTLGKIFEGLFVHFGSARSLSSALGRLFFGMIVTAASFVVLIYFAKPYPVIGYFLSCFIGTGLVPIAFEKEIKKYF